MYCTCMSKSFDQNVHVLLPKSDLQLLRRYAISEKRSVGELIRRAIKRVYGATEPNKRREAFERLSQHSELKMEDWSQVKQDLLRRYD